MKQGISPYQALVALLVERALVDAANGMRLEDILRKYAVPALAVGGAWYLTSRNDRPVRAPMRQPYPRRVGGRIRPRRIVA